jgi:PAS domain S-box-containing protein
LLADLIDELSFELIAGVEQTLSPTAAAVPLRRTLERLPGLLRDLVERLRATDETSEKAIPLIEFDVATLVAALRVLKKSLHARIAERRLPATPRELGIVGDWMAAVAESALLAENRRFAAMFDAIPDHLLFQNPDRILIYVNRATGDSAKGTAGMDQQEVLGHRVIDIVHDKKFGEYVDDCVTRVAAGESVTEEFLFPSPDGGRWHEHHLRPVYGPDGKVEAIVTASRDIHDRKKAEARLQLLSKLGALADTMEHESIIDAMAHLSIPELGDWCLINVTENGQSPRTAIAHRDPKKAELAEELLHLPSQLQMFRVGKAALAGNSTLIVDIARATQHPELIQAEIVRRLDVRSAMVVPFVVIGAPVAVATFMMTAESGRRFGPDDLALAQEMVQRAAQMIENARLHQQLRKSEQRFRVALEHANISVFETDLELRFRWGYNSMLGVPDGGALGRTLSDVVGREIGEEMDQLKRRVIETGEGARQAFSPIIDGKRRHLMARYEPLRGIGGIVGLTGATIDVTELKEAEEQLARELGFRERMMGILGHDLRNPVSAVLGLAGLVRLDDALSDKAREQLGLIEQAARRMNEMIGTLLDFTRLRFHGALPVAVEEIDLDEVMRGVVAELQAAHRRCTIELSATGNLRGQWDPARMAQVLSNLAANALSHGAPESPVRVALVGESQTVRLSVSNRGSVIPSELVGRLFDPFQQGTNGNARRGLGLGLFIVREIVRAHGGTIDVCSADELTTFAVTLPRTAPLP